MWPFHVMWTFSYHNGWSQGWSSQKRKPGSCITFDELFLEVKWHHLLYTTCWDNLNIYLLSRKEETDFSSRWGSGKVLEEQIRLELLLWQHLENITWHDIKDEWRECDTNISNRRGGNYKEGVFNNKKKMLVLSNILVLSCTLGMALSQAQWPSTKFLHCCDAFIHRVFA